MNLTLQCHVLRADLLSPQKSISAPGTPRGRALGPDAPPRNHKWQDDGTSFKSEVRGPERRLMYCCRCCCLSFTEPRHYSPSTWSTSPPDHRLGNNNTAFSTYPIGGASLALFYAAEEAASPGIQARLWCTLPARCCRGVWGCSLAWTHRGRGS